MANTQKVQSYEIGLQSLSKTLTNTLSAPPLAGEEAAFDAIIERHPDGAWRNKRATFNGKEESGLFLPPDASMDIHQKRLHFRTKQVLDAFGSSITTPTGLSLIHI